MAKYYKINPRTGAVIKEISITDAQHLRHNEYIREASFIEKLHEAKERAIVEQRQILQKEIDILYNN